MRKILAMRNLSLNIRNDLRPLYMKKTYRLQIALSLAHLVFTLFLI